MKFIFVTGGVVSGLGKGITAASLGRLLKERGLKVSAQKLDPYMNIDPGTMSPYQHGEVFVTEDGGETDLDLGHYERFMDENMTKYSNLTSGKVYDSVLSKERKGLYLGETVQVIPHITGEIKEFIYEGAKSSGADIMITEIGGTTGDIESQPFLEAIRQISLEQDREDCLFIHVTYIPYLKASKEHKSKPTQHSVKELRSMGISPQIIIARAEEAFDDSICKKIALFCNVKEECVIPNYTLPCLYEALLMLQKYKLDEVVCQMLGLNTKTPNLESWEGLIQRIKNVNKTVTVGIVGKYVKLHDAYLSVVESLRHAGYVYSAQIELRWIDSENLNENTTAAQLANLDAVLIPGGFGQRGVEGKLCAVRYAREHRVPFLGICLGMQAAVMEYARNVCGLKDADSDEFSSGTGHNVIHRMETQLNLENIGGTMRLGAYPCEIKPGTRLAELYGETLIWERHRHRCEYNNDYRDQLEKAGLITSGTSPDGTLAEAVEIKQHPFYVGVQFHPEFKSRPDKAHPVFCGFIKAGLEYYEREGGNHETESTLL